MFWRLCIIETYVYSLVSNVSDISYFFLCQCTFMGTDMWHTYWILSGKLYAILKQYILLFSEWHREGGPKRGICLIQITQQTETNIFCSRMPITFTFKTFFNMKIQLLKTLGNIAFVYYCYFNRVRYTKRMEADNTSLSSTMHLRQTNYIPP